MCLQIYALSWDEMAKLNNVPCSSMEPIHPYSHRSIEFSRIMCVPACDCIMLSTLTGYMPALQIRCSVDQ